MAEFAKKQCCECAGGECAFCGMPCDCMWKENGLCQERERNTAPDSKPRAQRSPPSSRRIETTCLGKLVFPGCEVSLRKYDASNQVTGCSASQRVAS